jgi:hypothetical protein
MADSLQTPSLLDMLQNPEVWSQYNAQMAGTTPQAAPQMAGTTPQAAPQPIGQNAVSQPSQVANDDPWAQISSAYGLGAPPAVGMPSTLPGVRLGAPPQLSLDSARFTDFMNTIGGRMQNAFNYNTPQASASLIDQSQIQTPGAQQFGESAELKKLLAGQGYTPESLAMMRATATQQPAQAGLQQMSQMKRALGDAGLSGGAAAALQSEVARQTGQAQGQALRDVDLENANRSIENVRFGVGQQTNIGLSNMQMANQMAMANANRLFEGLQSNQQAQNSTNQLNTSLQAQQGLAGASAQANFLGQQGAQWQDQANQREMENANKQFGTQLKQADYDWQKQTLPWQELNNRYGQSQQIMGGWGAQ